MNIDLDHVLTVRDALYFVLAYFGWTFIKTFVQSFTRAMKETKEAK